MGKWLLPLIPADKREEFHKMGDVNRDGYIDDADLELLKAAYGARPSSPQWNPECDLNGDGIVDGLDFTIAARNYGKDIFTWMGWPAQIYIELGIIGGIVTIIAGAGYAIYHFMFASK